MTEPCIKEKEIREIRDMAITHSADFGHIKKAIDTIENNHLAHMQASLENLDDKMDKSIEATKQSLSDNIEKIKQEINKINLKMAMWIGGGVVLFTIVQFLVNYIIKK